MTFVPKINEERRLSTKKIKLLLSERTTDIYYILGKSITMICLLLLRVFCLSHISSLHELLKTSFRKIYELTIHTEPPLSCQMPALAREKKPRNEQIILEKFSFSIKFRLTVPDLWDNVMQ